MELLILVAQSGRSRFFSGLWEGDPVAWTCLGIGVAVVVGGSVVRALLGRR